ncbi:hypothetical protein ACWCSH_21460, partial [Streptosporangium sp. NPDC001682]
RGRCGGRDGQDGRSATRRAAVLAISAMVAFSIVARPSPSVLRAPCPRAEKACSPRFADPARVRRKPAPRGSLTLPACGESLLAAVR